MFLSTFPDGWPGIGLLLLRAAVGLTAVAQGGACLADRGNPTFGTWVAGLAAIICGASLLVGFLTQAAGIVACLGSLGVALSWFPALTPNLLQARLSIVFGVTIAAAIVFLGPGAFSLDARLFGRREIIIPYASRSPKS